MGDEDDEGSRRSYDSVEVCVSVPYLLCDYCYGQRTIPYSHPITLQFMCRQIHEDIRKCIADDDSIEFDGDICVKLWESHKAWASYTG